MILKNQLKKNKQLDLKEKVNYEQYYGNNGYSVFFCNLSFNNYEIEEELKSFDSDKFSDKPSALNHCYAKFIKALVDLNEIDEYLKVIN